MLAALICFELICETKQTVAELTTLRCQINESTRLTFFEFFPRPTHLFGPTRSHFPPYLISKFSTLLVYLVHWSYSFMKFTQNIHPTCLFGPTRLIGT